ncbi:hypothetical protein D3C71_1904950 [compost metagenome]
MCSIHLIGCFFDPGDTAIGSEILENTLDCTIGLQGPRQFLVDDTVAIEVPRDCRGNPVHAFRSDLTACQ